MRCCYTNFTVCNGDLSANNNRLKTKKNWNKITLSQYCSLHCIIYVYYTQCVTSTYSWESKFCSSALAHISKWGLYEEIQIENIIFSEWTKINLSLTKICIFLGHWVKNSRRKKITSLHNSFVKEPLIKKNCVKKWLT